MPTATRVFATALCTGGCADAILPDGSPVQVSLSCLHKYLVELEEATGLWQLYAPVGSGHREGCLYWPVPICRLTSATLESWKFEMGKEVIEQGADLFGCLWAGIVEGDTYPVREELKALGGRWLPDRRAWAVPLDVYEEAKRLVEEQAQQEGVQPT